MIMVYDPKAKTVATKSGIQDCYCGCNLTDTMVTLIRLKEGGLSLNEAYMELMAIQLKDDEIFQYKSIP